MPDMEQSLHDRIRERAYEIWSVSGCMDGQSDQHWLAAEREVLAEMTAPVAAKMASRASGRRTREGANIAPQRKRRAKAS
jgi:hypothetical protein